MPFLPVPWAVEGGAKNVTEGSRLDTYVGSHGNDGIVGLDSLRVTQTPTASAAVLISTGAAVIPCRSAGYEFQAYATSRPVADDVTPVTANGGAGERCDLIVARVENPHLSTEAWPAPADPTVGPYVFGRVYQGVDPAVIASRAAARAFLRSIKASAIPLAGARLPAGQGVVLNSHLVDLRGVANPRTQRTLLPYAAPARVNVPGAWADWLAPTLWQLDVPEWATVARLVFTAFGTRMDRQSSGTDGQSAGDLRFRIGTVTGAVTKYDLTAPSSGGTTTRSTIGVADTVLIPSTLRGTLAQIAVQGDQTAGNQSLYADATTTVTLDVDFGETTT